MVDHASNDWSEVRSWVHTELELRIQGMASPKNFFAEPLNGAVAPWTVSVGEMVFAHESTYEMSQLLRSENSLDFPIWR